MRSQPLEVIVTTFEVIVDGLQMFSEASIPWTCSVLLLCARLLSIF